MDSSSLHRRLALPTIIALAIVFGGGCETASKRDIGTGVGAAIGALVGSQIDDGGLGGILVGAAVGGVVGRVIGSYMDDADREKVSATLDSTPTGETERWTNEDTGYEYAMTPTTGAYDSAEGECRDFEQEVFIDGRRELIKASACRQADDDPWAIEA